MPDVQLVPEGPADNKEDEEARQFILQVKGTIERCLAQRMNKVQMFRAIREEGLSTWIAFAVYKELREQNYGFFKEYYAMHDHKEQREKLAHLIQAYRTPGLTNALTAGARAPETTTTTAAAMETDTTASTEWLDGGIFHLLGSSTGGGDQFADGAGLPQPAVPSPGGQQVHDDDQPTVYQEWLRAMTWAEEEAPTPAPTRLGMHIDEQSLANGVFQGVSWPQPTAHLPPGHQQLQYQQEQAGHLQAGQQEQAVYFPAGQHLRYLEQAAQLPAGQRLHCQEQAVQLQAELLEQLMANGVFPTQGAPLTLAAGLPSNNVMDWPPLLDGIGWGHEQQGEPLLQRWPGSGADPSPSPTLPGAELLGSRNFHRRNNAGFHERTQ